MIDEVLIMEFMQNIWLLHCPFALWELYITALLYVIYIIIVSWLCAFYDVF